jgi:hypothetical protein
MQTHEVPRALSRSQRPAQLASIQIDDYDLRPPGALFDEEIAEVQVIVACPRVV